MSVTIVAKGESVPLRGKNTVQQALIGLGWNPNEGQSRHAFDLDASVVARDASGMVVDTCYYGNKEIGNWIKHTGDNLTGDGEGDDEQIQVNLAAVPTNVAVLDVVVNIYDGDQRAQNFGMVEGAFIRIENDQSMEIVRSDLSNDAEAFDRTGVHIARIKRDGPSWAFEAKHDFGAETATLQGFANAVLPA